MSSDAPKRLPGSQSHILIAVAQGLNQGIDRRRVADPPEGQSHSGTDVRVVAGAERHSERGNGRFADLAEGGGHPLPGLLIVGLERRNKRRDGRLPGIRKRTCGPPPHVFVRVMERTDEGFDGLRPPDPPERQR